MREDGLREVYVRSSVQRVSAELPTDDRRRPTDDRPTDDCRGPALDARARRPISTRLGVTLEPGWRVEINLRAVDWIRDAARRLRRGFIILIDYGHEARELYSPTHSSRHA